MRCRAYRCSDVGSLSDAIDIDVVVMACGIVVGRPIHPHSGLPATLGARMALEASRPGIVLGYCQGRSGVCWSIQWTNERDIGRHGWCGIGSRRELVHEALHPGGNLTAVEQRMHSELGIDLEPKRQSAWTRVGKGSKRVLRPQHGKIPKGGSKVLEWRAPAHDGGCIMQAGGTAEALCLDKSQDKMKSLNGSVRA